MTLPVWLAPLPDADGQRAIDAWAIDTWGADWLMEHAGTGLARIAERLAPTGRVVVLCGKGDNGGDGLCAAVKLRAAGRDVDVYALTTELDGEPGAWLARLDVPVQPLAALLAAPTHPGDAAPVVPARRSGPGNRAGLAGAALVIDALLGTGASGAPREPVAAVIAAVAAAGVPVLACDVPSGVDASTGEVAGAAIQAVATAAPHAAKPALWVAPGKRHAGAVEVVDLAVPPGHPQPADVGRLGPAVLDGYPRRGAAGSKFTSGAVAVLGGSRGLTGAPILAAHAALRAGAGYVTLAGAESDAAAFGARPVEVMLRPLPDRDGGLGTRAIEPALAAVRRAGAVVVGPGLGRGPETTAFVDAVLAGTDAALVLDADGLNALAGRFPAGLPARAGLSPGPAVPGRTGTSPRVGVPRTVLTPHAGELGRLLGIASDAVDAQRLHHVRVAAARSGAVVVLKGDDTLVAHPDGRVAVSPGDAPGLATAGTGDVLAGVVAALLARGMEPWHAACAAVWVHRCAGRLAARPHGPDGVIATDVIAHLPAALAG